MKIKIHSDLKIGTEISVYDYSKLAHSLNEAVVEVHYNYEPINRYDVFFYPEHFENAKEALNGPVNFVCHVVYHMPAMPTYDQLFDEGRKLASDNEGTCFLYRYKGADYVVLPDNTVITHEEDMAGDAIFPTPFIC